ncbi:sulfotransferase domain-containing protein [Altibacter sp. HG106]|uniref:sulfotransferase domain-containing protein n=1 Tax=Altibacter sp. HG106 TaxID=3023937 RepID=UPI0023504B72|nr:sulfotransferase domain-containing protein [Altibacter sp. HG106]MDC7995362.1 sulfotransferase [Altibacter sp. HG106]
MPTETNKPNLFLLGAPKCGTTSMIYYMSQHPEIFMSPEKEPHYFNTDSGHRYYFDLDSYLSLFDEASQEHSYRCEGSVWYLYSEVAVQNILAFHPDAKFIIMLREPSSMYFSLHQELLYGGSENEASPKTAWDLQALRKDGKRIPLGCSDPRLLQYGDACSLGAQVKRALNYIPKEQLHLIFIDDLKNDADAAFLKLQAFLGVTPVSLDSYDVVNKKKVRKSYMLSQFLIAATQLKKRLGIKGGLGLANAINKKNVAHDVSLTHEDSAEMIPMLKAYFQKDVALLEQLSGRDLSHWKSNA